MSDLSDSVLPLVRKDVYSNRWKVVGRRADAADEPDQHADVPHSALRVSSARSSRVSSAKSQSSQNTHSTTMGRPYSGRSQQTAVSVDAPRLPPHAFPSPGTRVTIFTPRRKSDPVFNPQPLTAHCDSDRCCRFVQPQCEYRLLPSFQGTFGPPPDTDKIRSHLRHVADIVNADARHTPRTRGEPQSTPATTARTSASALEGTSPSTPKTSEVTAALSEIDAFEKQWIQPGKGAIGIVEVAAVVQPSAVANLVTGVPTDGSTVPTSPTKRSVAPRPPASQNRTTTNKALLLPSKSQRHAWIINALHEEGKLNRASSFVTPGKSSIDMSRTRRISSLPTAGTNTVDMLDLSAQNAAAGAVSVADGDASKSKGAASNGNMESGLRHATRIQCLDWATQFVVAVLVRRTFPQIVEEYRRFVDRHRPTTQAVRAAAVAPDLAPVVTSAPSSAGLRRNEGNLTIEIPQSAAVATPCRRNSQIYSSYINSAAATAASNGGAPSRIQFMVHHQAGLTLPQFALFLDECMLSGNNRSEATLERRTPSVSSGTGAEDSLVSEARIKLAFHVLADPISKRLPASDLLATVALAIVPSHVQSSAEHFLNMFDTDNKGFVPRTLFHFRFIQKFKERHVDQACVAVWEFYENLLRRLLKHKHPILVYLLNEVISAPLTAMARSRLTHDGGESEDDPAGVFTTHGDSRPLAITVREALCVIYGVQELSNFFQTNSLLVA